MFENAKNSTKQGDIGEARAIYEYTKLGYGVSRTIFDSEKYDLIVDKRGKLIKVQVKTSDFICETGVYQLSLKVSGGNKTNNNIRNREDSDYDELFVMCGNDDCYIIPITEKVGKTTIKLGKKYENYKLKK